MPFELGSSPSVESSTPAFITSSMKGPIRSNISGGGGAPDSESLSALSNPRYRIVVVPVVFEPRARPRVGFDPKEARRRPHVERRRARSTRRSGLFPAQTVRLRAWLGRPAGVAWFARVGKPARRASASACFFDFSASSGDSVSGRAACSAASFFALAASSFPSQHFLYFFPDPHGQGSLRTGLVASSFMADIVSAVGEE